MTIKQIKRKIRSTERRAEKVNDELESLKGQLYLLERQKLLDHFGISFDDEVIIETIAGQKITCQLSEDILFHENGSVTLLYFQGSVFSNDIYLHEIKSITKK